MKEKYLEAFDELSDEQQIQMHNDYCQSCDYRDDEIYVNDEDFFDTYFNNKTMDAIRACFYGDYRYSDNYVKFNGYANLESFDYPDSHIDASDIIDDYMENPRNYSIELEVEEEEEEEEEEDEEEE